MAFGGIGDSKEHRCSPEQFNLKAEGVFRNFGVAACERMRKRRSSGLKTWL